MTVPRDEYCATIVRADQFEVGLAFLQSVVDAHNCTDPRNLFWEAVPLRSGEVQMAVRWPCGGKR